MNNRIIALIVTYNPDIHLLRNNIDGLINQVNKVLVIDNASNNISEIKALCDAYNAVFLLENQENIGLPVNYNRAARYAQSEGAEWMLIMDQDTIVPENLIKEYTEFFNNNDIAILTPIIWDTNAYNFDEIKSSLPEEKVTMVKTCISSASLVRISTLMSLGGFDENLFIDMVDIDYCINVINHGYRIVRINDVIVKHQIGKSKERRFLWFKFKCMNHPAERKYYMLRNRVYCARKWKLSLLKESRYYMILVSQIISIAYENGKKDKTIMAIKGIADGFKMKILL